MLQRGSGILCHITSLPSKFGIGDLGPSAYAFADALARSGQTYWQILPLTPIDASLGYSPYNSSSSYAGNPLVISPELLVQDGFLDAADVSGIPSFPSDFVDFPWVNECKNKIFEKAFLRFDSNRPEYQQFLAEQSWVNDYALFAALKKFFSNHAWNRWPQDIRDRDEESLKYFTGRYQSQLDYVKFLQFLFFGQWRRLKSYCAGKNIQIIGDIPIYVSYDSVDVWAHPHFFKLDHDRRQTAVAGVPPDYFSESGQRWGNPVYDWDALKRQNFRWWIDRLRHNLQMYDVVRIDHFRGLVQYWEILASEKTAVNGRWHPVPTKEFLDTLSVEFPSCPILAEDLGMITDDVHDVMNIYGFPGMKVLLFAFGDDETNLYLPENYPENCVAYVGTHDNNTARGWYENEITAKEKNHLQEYLGKIVRPEDIAWELTLRVFWSRAAVAIVSLQDLLNLDASARMNIPGTMDNNWRWKSPSPGDGQMWNRLADLTREAHRQNLKTQRS